MSQSITNKLIANIKQSNLNGDTRNFINSENVICIDSSNNRIGINKRNPLYSIDISGRNLRKIKTWGVRCGVCWFRTSEG